ncbi:MAG: translation initiation factor IF-2 subunit alpha [Candidatus Heimdallarchaeaceae archaeon]|jgi:translation initiation factor 2 subunit 1
MSRRNLPESGDLVIGTVKSIFDHGVYVNLDEYEDLQAYCHVSEVSSTWVRNIRNVMRIGKKVVGRVMRVKENQIDISIKRVSDGLKRTKVEEWKRYRTAITLLEMGAKQRKIDFETARTEVEDIATETYGNLYQAFEESLFKGESVFTEAGISEEWATVLTNIAKKNLTIPKISITRDVEIICWEGNGVNLIRDALKSALEARKEIEAEEEELKIEMYVRGAPIYRFVISARDYQLAEELISKAYTNLENSLSSYNATINMIESK